MTVNGTRTIRQLHFDSALLRGCDDDCSVTRGRTYVRPRYALVIDRSLDVHYLLLNLSDSGHDNAPHFDDVIEEGHDVARWDLRDGQRTRVRREELQAVLLGVFLILKCTLLRDETAQRLGRGLDRSWRARRD